MRVFYFITKSETGGAQSVIYELLHAHRARGDQVVVMAEGQGWLAQETQKMGFNYEENPFIRKTYNPRILLRAIRRYRMAVGKFSPDVVSVHSSFSGFIGRIALRNRYPVVYTTHGWGFTYGWGGYRWIGVLLEKFAARFCRAIICVSERDRRIAREYHIAPEHMLVQIYNGVDVGGRQANDQGRIRIGFVGRFDWPKHQALLVDAVALLPITLQEKITMVFIGGGSHIDKIKEKAPKAIFVGEVSRGEALDLLSTCTISVLLSASEGFPLSVIESLQLGLPVLANAVGGIPEVIDMNVGILVPQEPSASVVAEALTTLLADTSVRTVLASNAKDRGQQFSVESMIRQTFSLYDGIVTL